MPKLFSVFFILFPILSFSQNVKFKGIVIDSRTKKGISGVSITIDQYHGSITDENGGFEILISDNLTKESKIKFTCTGFKPKVIAYSQNTFNKIEMVHIANNLDEVIVFTKGKSIIENAITRIPVNYSTKPNVLNGIIRIYNVINDGDSISDSDYFYKSDAIVKVYSESYASGSLEQQVKVVQNKVLKIKKNKYNLMGSWVGGYHNVGDLVYDKPDYINLKKIKNYNFYKHEKKIINGKTTYEIRFESKGGKKVEGRMLIDSASYAFVKVEAIYHQSSIALFFLPISTLSKSSEYELKGNTWYLKNSHQKAVYTTQFNGIEVTDFAATTIDTSTTTEFRYKDVMQKMDKNEDVVINGNNNEWIKYDTLFEKEVLNRNITALNIPIIDTTDNNKSDNNKSEVDFFSSIIAYLMNDNVKLAISLSKNAICVSQQKYSYSSEYGIGLQSSFRLYRNTFFRTRIIQNFGMGRIKNTSNSYMIANEFVTNKSNHPIIFTPYTGITTILLKDKTLNENVQFSNLETGMDISLERTRKKYFFITGSYSHTFKQTESFLSITPTQFSFGAGIILKL